jgi:hypothetical protein
MQVRRRRADPHQPPGDALLDHAALRESGAGCSLGAMGPDAGRRCQDHPPRRARRTCGIPSPHPPRSAASCRASRGLGVPSPVPLRRRYGARLPGGCHEHPASLPRALREMSDQAVPARQGARHRGAEGASTKPRCQDVGEGTRPSRVRRPDHPCPAAHGRKPVEPRSDRHATSTGIIPVGITLGFTVPDEPGVHATGAIPVSGRTGVRCPRPVHPRCPHGAGSVTRRCVGQATFDAPGSTCCCRRQAWAAALHAPAAMTTLREAANG